MGMIISTEKLVEILSPMEKFGEKNIVELVVRRKAFRTKDGSKFKGKNVVVISGGLI